GESQGCQRTTLQHGEAEGARLPREIRPRLDHHELMSDDAPAGPIARAMIRQNAVDHLRQFVGLVWSCLGIAGDASAAGAITSGAIPGHAIAIGAIARGFVMAEGAMKPVVAVVVAIAAGIAVAIAPSIAIAPGIAVAVAAGIAVAVAAG